MKISAKTPGIAALGLTALSSVHAAQAQTTTVGDVVLPTTGTKEIGLAGNYTFNTPKSYFLQGSYGVFTSPVLELGGQIGVAGADHISTTTNVGAFADYYFRGGTENASPLLPYVGITGGYINASHYNSASIGGQAGVKYFLNSNVSVNAAFDYNAARHSSGQSQLVLGLSTYLR